MNKNAQSIDKLINEINNLIEEEIQNRYELDKTNPTVNTSKLLVLQEIRYALENIKEDDEPEINTNIEKSINSVINTYKDQPETMIRIIKEASNTSMFDNIWYTISELIEDSIIQQM